MKITLRSEHAQRRAGGVCALRCARWRHFSSRSSSLQQQCSGWTLLSLSLSLSLSARAAAQRSLSAARETKAHSPPPPPTGSLSYIRNYIDTVVYDITLQQHYIIHAFLTVVVDVVVSQPTHRFRARREPKGGQIKRKHACKYTSSSIRQTVCGYIILRRDAVRKYMRICIVSLYVISVGARATRYAPLTSRAAAATLRARASPAAADTCRPQRHSRFERSANCRLPLSPGLVYLYIYAERSGSGWERRDAQRREDIGERFLAESRKSDTLTRARFPGAR